MHYPIEAICPTCSCKFLGLTHYAWEPRRYSLYGCYQHRVLRVGIIFADGPARGAYEREMREKNAQFGDSES